MSLSVENSSADYINEFISVNGARINIDEVKSENCKRSFFYFFQQFISTIEPRNFIYAPHVEYLCNLGQSIFYDFQNGKPGKIYIINVPPSSSKSLIFSVLYPAWCFAVDPTFKIISASVTKDVSVELSVKTRTIMQSSKYQRYFPLTKLKDDEAGKENYKTTLGGMRAATAVNSNIISRHACLILADDLQNTEIVKKSTERQSSNEFFYNALSTRVVDALTVPKILIQQRLHYYDNTAYILEREKDRPDNIVHICLPGEVRKGKDGKWDFSKASPESAVSLYSYDQVTDSMLLDPVRGSGAALDKRESELGSYQYKVQVLQDPEDEEEAAIKREWFTIIDAAQFAEILKNSPNAVTNFYIDTSFTDNSKTGKNDPSVILAVINANNTLYVRKLMRGFYDFPDLVKNIQDFVSANGYTSRSKIFIEPKTSGISVISYLKKQTVLNVYEARLPMEDKSVRLLAASASWESGRVTLLEGAWNTTLLDEVCAMHRKFWDITDTLVMATQHEIISKSLNTGKSPVGVR